MKERPIIFSAPMVRAILAGQKTQTRRLVKARKCPDFGCEMSPGEIAGDEDQQRLCPYGQPGDRLWVRETFAQPDCRSAGFSPWIYAADYEIRPGHRWQPSIHMPHSASRITLEITGIRVERLQDISEADAIAEGCAQNRNGYFLGGPHAVSGRKQMVTATEAYRDLWESLKGAGSWGKNPWVWVVGFRRIETSKP